MWPSLAPFLLINPGSGKGSPTADELAAEARAIGAQTMSCGRATTRRSWPEPRMPTLWAWREATVDGEPDVLETPLEFRIEPRALRVLVPAERG
jgi:hypothetical protein